MITLGLIVFLSVALSACCSLMEAALLSVPVPHVKHLADKGLTSGKLLQRFKHEPGRPISAILILNTISNSFGAALAGAMVGSLFGEQSVIVFSIVFTLLILCVSEILPKQFGFTYAKETAVFIARPLSVLIKLLWPMVKMAEVLSSSVSREAAGPKVSMHEVLSMAEIGREEGVLDHLEGSVIRNVVGLDRLQVKDVLTPRVVVFRLEASTKLSEVKTSLADWTHTRVPLFKEEEPDRVERYVIQRDLFRALIKEEKDLTLEQFSRPLTTVTEYMRADKLLLQMFELRESLCSVVDEHGGFAGIVTMEDIIEEIVGREIVDEYDIVSDLRSYAQILHARNKTEE